MKASLQVKQTDTCGLPALSGHARKLSRASSRAGQALLELALVLVTLLVLLMGVIDFGRILLAKQIMTNVTREGANLASRAMSVSNAVNAMIQSAGSLDIPHKGYVIITTVTRDSGGPRIIEQVKSGGKVYSSRIGASGAAQNLPNSFVPQTNGTVAIAEIYSTFTPITPVGNLLGGALPSLLYDIAYF